MHRLLHERVGKQGPPLKPSCVYHHETIAQTLALIKDLTIVAVSVPSLTNQFKTVADLGWYSAA